MGDTLGAGLVMSQMSNWFGGWFAPTLDGWDSKAIIYVGSTFFWGSLVIWDAKSTHHKPSFFCPLDHCFNVWVFFFA